MTEDAPEGYPGIVRRAGRLDWENGDNRTGSDLMGTWDGLG